MTRKSWDKEELNNASNHLYYEITMLIAIANGLKSNVAGQGPIANALLESFIIHTRNLVNFFYNDNPKKDDIVAIDFFSSPDEWIKNRPSQPEVLESAKDRAEKELAHLTWKRISHIVESKQWQYVEIQDEIKRVMNIFLQKVSKELIVHNLQTLGSMI